MRRAIAAAAFAASIVASAATASAQSVSVFSDDFESGGGNFTITLGSVQANNGPTGIGDDALVFGGEDESGGGDREAYTSSALDLYEGIAAVRFDLKYASDGSSVLNFDDIDSDAEEVRLGYSIDNGTRVEVTSFDYQDSTYNNWATVTVYLPDGARTTGVRIHFYQTSFGQNEDTWAIDNVNVLVSPEPGSIALFGGGAAALLGTVLARRRRRRAVSGASRRAP
jgi:hypothetical protein